MAKDSFQQFSSSLGNQREIPHATSKADLSNERNPQQKDREGLHLSVDKMDKTSPFMKSAILTNEKQTLQRKDCVSFKTIESDCKVICFSESKEQKHDILLQPSSKVSYRNVVSNAKINNGKDFCVKDEQGESNISTFLESTQKSAFDLKSFLDNEKPSIEKSSDFKRSSSEKSFNRLKHNQWNAMFDELKTYKAKNGNCFVPSKYTPNMQLSRWVKEQRQSYQMLQSGGAVCLNEERLKALESIGFAWMAHDIVWMDRFNELKDFKKRHGHCLVPARYHPNRRLERWVNKQRVYKRLSKDGKRTSLSECRSKMLDDLGFSWNVKIVSHKNINTEEVEAVTEACNNQNPQVEYNVEDMIHKCGSENTSTNISAKDSYTSETFSEINSKTSQNETENSEENITHSNHDTIGEIGEVSGPKISPSKRKYDEISSSSTSLDFIQPNRAICGKNCTRQFAMNAKKAVKKEHCSILENSEKKQGKDQIPERMNASVTAFIHHSLSPHISDSISNAEFTSLENNEKIKHQNLSHDNTDTSQGSIFSTFAFLPPLHQFHPETTNNIHNIFLPNTTDEITNHTSNQMVLNQCPIFQNLAPSHSIILPGTVHSNFSSLSDTIHCPNFSTIITRPLRTHPQVNNNMFLYWN